MSEGKVLFLLVSLLIVSVTAAISHNNNNHFKLEMKKLEMNITPCVKYVPVYEVTQ